MKRSLKLIGLVGLMAIMLTLVACSEETPAPAATALPVPTAKVIVEQVEVEKIVEVEVEVVVTATPEPTAVPPAEVKIYSFSNSSPHVTEIDAATNTVIRTSDITDLVKLAWNDDGNYFDGQDLWLTGKDSDAKTSELIFLNLTSLEVSGRLDLGSNPANAYLGGGLSTKGEVFVGLQGNMDQAGEIVVVKASTKEIVDRIPVNQIACDVDIQVGTDGIERLFTPNQKMDAVQNFDATTRELIATADMPEGSNPFMLTAAPNGKHIWVQDGSAGTNTVLDSKTLAVVATIPTGEGPVVASFSPDGKYGYVGHYKATTMTVIDAVTFEIVAQVETGPSPSKIAVHPNGNFVYTLVSKENAIAVIDTSTWKVTTKIYVESSPGGLFINSN
jgi:YVTN family beta-propeller protein